MKHYEVPEGKKRCPECTDTKDRSEFYKDRSRHDGLRRLCKLCDKARRNRVNKGEKPSEDKFAQWVESHAAVPVEEKKRRYQSDYLMRTYGISLEQYEAMCAERENCCDICGETQETLHVDHCHKEGHVRGLLCMHCNMGIGHFRDSTERLASAIAYLTLLSGAFSVFRYNGVDTIRILLGVPNGRNTYG